MEFLVLGGLAAAGYWYLISPYENNGLAMDVDRDINSLEGRQQMTEVTKYKDPMPKQRGHMFDFSEAGITYGVTHPLNLNLTNLNEAYKPYTAPMQKSTRDMTAIFEDQAKTLAYMEATSTPFYFNEREGSIVLSGNQNANPLVEIPGRNSFRWDPEQSLVYYPRVYIQSGTENKVKTSEPYDKLLNAGMPTEHEKKWVPLEGRLNREWNPWGPGGQLQTLFTGYQQKRTLRKGADQAVIMQPVWDSRVRNI